MLRDEIKQLKTDPDNLRKFGLVVGGVFALLAFWFWWRHKPVYVWFATPAAPLLLVGVVYPKALRLVYVIWMSGAFVLGMVVSTILLTLFFYLVVTPIGLLARGVGKDFLSRKLNPSAGSYWLKRDLSISKAKSEYEQQF